MRKTWLGCGAVLLLATMAMAGDLDVIVGFKGDADAGIIRSYKGTVGRTLKGLDAMAATMPAARIAALRADASVAYVEENGIYEILKRGGNKPGNTPPPQERPWGIDRVGGGLSSGPTGTGVKVAIIDSGIDADHSDLAGNVKGTVDFTGSRKGAEDEHGHGTHVAGTIAALDNSIGVIGVAPTAGIYAVRVLNRRGSGTWANVASGIRWTGDKGMDLGNMSIGGGFSSTVQNACSYAAGKGVLLLGASGNSGDGNLGTTETSYPAAFGTVVSVGATSKGDGLASFSNTSPTVEVSGPGVSVKSTYKGNGYQTWNGTSMACPHACGVAALLLEEMNFAASVADLRAALVAHTDDRGPGGRDNGFGWGIVNYLK